jgi:hypothetical protein
VAGFAFILAIGGASMIAGIAKVAVVFPFYRSVTEIWGWKQRNSILSKTEQFAAIVACCLPAFRIYLRSSKNRRAGRSEEPKFAGGSGGNVLGKGFKASDGMELESYEESTGETLADRDEETLPDRDQETLPDRDPEA